MYIDHSSIDYLKGDGHNYFRSRNIVKVKSAAMFGEGYWRIEEGAKLSMGLRYTHDVKISTPVPSQLLLAPGPDARGNVQSGYPEKMKIRQDWEELTGRLVLDWKPDLAFTDSTMIYTSITRGYKAGGINAPGPDINSYYFRLPTRPQTFRPEYNVSFEIGSKNTLLDGNLQLNATAFHYGYRDYQVSKYVDRSIFTENFDATVLGAELEAIWQATPRLRIDGHVGILRTRIANGERSIDVMDRTQGNPDWSVVQPWIQIPSNCIAPTSVLEQLLRYSDTHRLVVSGLVFNSLCTGDLQLNNLLLQSRIPPETGIVYDPLLYPDVGQNQGQGFFADLSGNELPGAPHLTFSLGAQYTWPVAKEWGLTVRGDYFRQSASWARVYNAVNDRLRGWDNANLSVTLSHPRSAFTVQFYVKNVFDKTPITGTFINGDDSGLTTNVFTLDPRILGVVVSKDFL